MSRISLGSSGWVYCAVSAAHPDLCKLGATTNDPLLRAKQLTASTSAPTPFTMAYTRWVKDVTAAEAALHEIFADRRVNEGREFFQVSVMEAVMAMDRVAGGDSEWAHRPPTPFAELFATFPDDGSGRQLSESEQRQCRELEARLRKERAVEARGQGAEDWRQAA